VTTPSAYDTTDPNMGVTPIVVATAYDNNVAPFPAAGVTVQYSIEATQNAYAIQLKSMGTLQTVVTLPVDVIDFAGFDISGATRKGYAILNTGDGPALYEVGIANGTLKRLAVDIGDVADLTIVP
jgi:hypothetical protein